MTTMLLILVTAIAPCPFDAAGSAGDPLVWSAPVALLVAGVLAVPVSVGLLFLYRRAVVRRMRATAVPSGSRALAQPPLAPAALPPRLLIAVSEADGPAGPDPAAEPFVHGAFGDLRRAGAVQLAGGAAFGVVLVMPAEVNFPYQIKRKAVDIGLCLHPLVHCADMHVVHVQQKITIGLAQHRQ